MLLHYYYIFFTTLYELTFISYLCKAKNTILRGSMAYLREIEVKPRLHEI